MTRIIRNARPSPITNADRERQRIAIMRHDERIASARRIDRICRLFYICGAFALIVTFFYSF